MSNKNNITETELQERKVVTRYDRRMQKRKEQEEKDKREKKIATIVGIIAAVVIVAVIAFFPIRSAIARNQTFVEVGGEKVTRVEFDYYYGTALNNYYSQYGTYMSMMGVDLSADLSTQMYTDNLSWKDFFEEAAINNIKQDKAVQKKIKEEGFTYDTTESWKAYKASMEEQAAANGLTLNQMVQYSFGSFATVGSVKELVENSMTVSAFLNKVGEDNAPGEDKILEIYENNKASYDSVDYRIVEVAAELPTEPTELADPAEDEAEDEDSEAEYEPSEAEIEAAMAEAKKAADDAVKTVDKDGELVEDATASYVSSLYSDWLFDDARKAGDTTVIEDETNYKYYVLAFEKRYLKDNPTASVYIINVTNGSGQTILNLWNQDPTLTNFINLFNEYDGYAYGPANGFYEGLSSRDILGEPGEWIFAEERQVGDVTLISVEEDSDYVMYFAGKGDIDWKEAIRGEYKETYMINYISELIVDVEVKDPKGNLNYLKVAEAEAEATAGTEETAETAE